MRLQTISPNVARRPRRPRPSVHSLSLSSVLLFPEGSVPIPALISRGWGGRKATYQASKHSLHAPSSLASFSTRSVVYMHTNMQAKIAHCFTRVDAVANNLFLAISSSPLLDSDSAEPCFCRSSLSPVPNSSAPCPCPLLACVASSFSNVADSKELLHIRKM